MLAAHPFLEKIVTAANKETGWGKNFSRFLDDIQMRQADEKLLKAQPLHVIASDRLMVYGGCWLYSLHCFWIVSLAEVIRLKEKVHKTYKDKTIEEPAEAIASQLYGFLDRDVQYIVGFDHEVFDGDVSANITIYEMGGLAWRDLCHQIKSGEK